VIFTTEDVKENTEKDMLQNFQALNDIVSEYECEHPLTLAQKYALLEAMYREARLFGHFAPESTFNDLEADIRVAKILNAKL
jgi:hypothetical protein